MCGVIPSILYAVFMACTTTNLPSTVPSGSHAVEWPDAYWTMYMITRGRKWSWHNSRHCRTEENWPWQPVSESKLEVRISQLWNRTTTQRPRSTMIRRKQGSVMSTARTLQVDLIGRALMLYGKELRFNCWVWSILSARIYTPQTDGSIWGAVGCKSYSQNFSLFHLVPHSCTFTYVSASLLNWEFFMNA